MNIYPPEQEIVQNLRDAGCSADTISAFVSDLRQGNRQTGQRRLERYRRTLLDELHQVQRNIDRLDYLFYQIKKDA